MWYCKFCEVEVQEFTHADGYDTPRWMHTPNGNRFRAHWFCERSVAWPKGVPGG